MKDISDILNQINQFEYPVPDPEWDYSAGWPYIYYINQLADQLAAKMQDTEEATPELDEEFRATLGAIAHLVREAERVQFPEEQQPSDGFKVI